MLRPVTGSVVGRQAFVSPGELLREGAATGG